MTAIVGLIDKGKVYMGADSAGVGPGYLLNVRKDEKVFMNGDFLIGFTTSFRMGQLLRWKLITPDHPKGMPTIEYMHKIFIDAVKQCLKENGYSKIENNKEQGGTFLVGYRGELFYIGSDFQIGQNHDPFDACGCGNDILLGSMITSACYQILPCTRISLALSAAERYSAGVRKPFVLLDSDGQSYNI